MSMKDEDFASMPLDELRTERDSLRAEEDAVSFVRRLAQGRVDLVAAVRAHRESDGTGSVADIIRSGVGSAPSTGSSRPPRDTEVAADHPLMEEFESLSDRLGFDDMVELDLEALTELGRGLADFEVQMSARRRELFDRIDALTAELVRRYRDGDASVDSLLQG
jgi:hypothetical protein